MEAFVHSQNRSGLLERRSDYLALAPAAAAICYPFLLRAFHAVIGTQAVSPSPLAIVGATMILAAAFVVPFLGLALACRQSGDETVTAFSTESESRGIGGFPKPLR
jgi:hypothetical protein